MRVFSRSILAVAVVCLFFSVVPYATGAETEGYASVDYFSNYMWRGQKLSEESVLQPSIGIYYNGFGANLWANYDFDTEEHNETDLTLSYGTTNDKFSTEIGYVYYGLDGYEDTQETYISFSYDVVLNPSMTFYYDFDQGDGGFLEMSIGHSIPLTKDVFLNLGAMATVNFDNEVMGLDEDGDPITDFYNGQISASIPIALHEHFTIEPVIAYSFPLSSDAEDAIEAASFDGDSEVLYGGINLSLSF